MPCVFRVRPAREKGGSSRVSAQPPLSRQRGRSILAKEALDPGRRGRSLSAKGALNAPFASLKRKDLPLLPPATLPPTFPHRPEKRGKDWKRAHKKEVFFCRFCEKRPEKTAVKETIGNVNIPKKRARPLIFEGTGPIIGSSGEKWWKKARNTTRG
ncbi:hypothetical protein HMPREF0262_01457 [Clostridium sp. ATCC 29733]|nr:hypothetical protein HMPREF0262_01457 [Clostridium sp. ATCC 29733]